MKSSLHIHHFSLLIGCGKSGDKERVGVNGGKWHPEALWDGVSSRWILYFGKSDDDLANVEDAQQNGYSFFLHG
jgi:hypothetical protein